MNTKITDEVLDHNVIFSLLSSLTDPQYCDTEDGSNYSKTVIRRYRQSLDILKEAVTVFQQHGTCCNVVLGDTIDGKSYLIIELCFLYRAPSNQHIFAFIIQGARRH